MRLVILAAAICLAACQPTTPAPNPAPEPTPTSAAPREGQASPPVEAVTQAPAAPAPAADASVLQTAKRLEVLGTEPFWHLDITGTEMNHSTPENQAGDHYQVERAALPDGGVRYSGEAGITAFTVEIVPGECSDGMSDETYAYRAVFQLGRQTLNGCARIALP